MIPPQWATDIKDPRDFRYTEVFGVSELPRSILYDRTSIYNQWEKHTPDTTYACTCYGVTHCVNEWNFLEASKYHATLKKELDPVYIWNKALNLPLPSQRPNIKTGWSLQSAVKLMMDLGCITGYTLCRSVGEVKQALANGQQVYTGSNQIDWEATKKNGMIAVRGTSYGHAFKCDGFDDDKELLTMRNSYWPNAYDNGRFYVRYKDFDILFSCYALTDANSPEIADYQDKVRRELAKERWYYNGEGNDIPLIRQDAVYMAMRVGNKTKDTGIWNKKNPMVYVTEKEFKTMLEKATWRKVIWIMDSDKPITRGQAASFSVRI